MFQVTTDDKRKYKVNLAIVKQRDNAAPYIGLLRKEIKNGEGLVQIYGRDDAEDWCTVYAADTYSYIMGGVGIPLSALIAA